MNIRSLIPSLVAGLPVQSKTLLSLTVNNQAFSIYLRYISHICYIETYSGLIMIIMSQSYESRRPSRVFERHYLDRGKRRHVTASLFSFQDPSISCCKRKSSYRRNQNSNHSRKHNLSPQTSLQLHFHCDRNHSSCHPTFLASGT